MGVSYSFVRRRHLILALRSLSRRQQTTLVLAVAMLGPPSVIGLMHAATYGLQALVSPGTSPAVRAAVWLCWLTLTGLVVLALREPVFMLAARPFLRMLPISRGRHLACDVRSIAIAYSLLWIPIGYFVWATWSSPRGLFPKVDATLTLACGIAIGIAFHALLPQGRASALAVSLFAAAVFCIAPSTAWPGSWLVLFAALVLAVLALASGYEQRGRSRAIAAIASPLASRVAAWSGLSIPVAWRDLRHAIGLRLVFLAALVATGLYFARDGAFCGRRTGFLIVESALVALALYRVPALVDGRLIETLPWLFRLKRARLRALGAIGVMTAAALACTLGVASSTWIASCGAVSWQPIAVTFAIAWALLAGAALRWKVASAGVAVLALMVLTFALGEAL